MTAIDPEKRARIVELAQSGMGRNQIAREVGLARSTVSKVCETAGVTFDRRASEAATRASVLDAKAKRAEMLQQQLDIQWLTQKRMLDVLEKRNTWATLVRAPMGSQETRRLAYIPADDFQKTQNGLSSGMQVINRIEETLNPAAEEAGNLLDKIAEQLGITDA